MNIYPQRSLHEFPRHTCTPTNTIDVLVGNCGQHQHDKYLVLDCMPHSSENTEGKKGNLLHPPASKWQLVRQLTVISSTVHPPPLQTVLLQRAIHSALHDDTVSSASHQSSHHIILSTYCGLICAHTLLPLTTLIS